MFLDDDHGAPFAAHISIRVKEFDAGSTGRDSTLGFLELDLFFFDWGFSAAVRVLVLFTRWR